MHRYVMPEEILVIGMPEEKGWSGGSPNLGTNFLVFGESQAEVMNKMKELLAPLVTHGLRYRFLGQTDHDAPRPE